MLISKRRLQWGMIGFLILFTVLTVRPLRSWLDRSLVHYLIDSRMSVAQVEIHSQASAIRATEFQWRTDRARKSFAIEADDAWFAIEGEPLLDRQIVMPRVVIEQASLHRLDHTPGPPSKPSSWQRKLIRTVKSIDWEELERHFGSLLAAEDLNSTWQSRFEKWMQRSNEIISEVQAIAARDYSAHNPLRDEIAIKLQLAKVDALADEQRQLAERFDGLQRLLKAEQRRVEERFASEIEELPSLLGESVSKTRKSTRTGADAAERAEARSLSVHLWEALADYGEVADAMVRGLPNDFSPGYDQHARLNAPSDAWLELQDLLVSGTYYHRDHRTPFTLEAGFSSGSRNGVDQEFTGRWNYLFHQRKCEIEVSTDHPTSQNQLVSLHVKVLANAASEDHSPSDIVILPDRFTTDSARDAKQTWLEIDLTADENGVVSGVMDVNETATQLLAETSQGARDEADRLDQVGVTFVNRKPLRVRISGTWEAPQFRFDEKLPRWLTISDRITHATPGPAEVETTMRQRLVASQAKLDELAQKAATASEAITQHHQGLLADTSRALSESLSELGGASFARRPDSATTR